MIDDARQGLEGRRGAYGRDVEARGIQGFRFDFRLNVVRLRLDGDAERGFIGSLQLDRTRNLQRLISATPAATARPLLRQPHDAVVLTVGLDDVVHPFRRQADQQQDQAHPDDVADRRCRKGPAHAILGRAELKGHIPRRQRVGHDRQLAERRKGVTFEASLWGDTA